MSDHEARRTLGVVVGVLFLFVAGCKEQGGSKAAASPPPPPTVEFVTVAPQTIPIEYAFVGMTEASKVVEIRARVSGFLLARGFDEGKPIHAGDPLFQIDPRPFEADLEIARARLEQAQARSRLAELEERRYADAIAKGAVAQRELDLAQTELADAKASVRLAEASVAKAELDLSYTQIESPVTGVIGRTLKDEGSYLDAGPESLLAEAMQIDPIYVNFAIPERDWLQWRSDLAAGTITIDGDPMRAPVRVELLNGEIYPHTGEMTFFDTRLDPRTGAAQARASFANPDRLLKPGQFVKARVIGWQRPNSIIIPTRAVIQNPGGANVMVVDAQDTAQLKPITLGEWHGDGWLALTGLSPGDRVISDGFFRARPGMKVHPVPAGSATGHAEPSAAGSASSAPASTSNPPAPSGPTSPIKSAPTPATTEPTHTNQGSAT